MATATSSRFRMQIVDTVTGNVVEFEPGMAVETDLVRDIVARVVGKGVGFFKTTSHVARDVEAGITDAIFELKKKVPPKM